MKLVGQKQRFTNSISLSLLRAVKPGQYLPCAITLRLCSHELVPRLITNLMTFLTSEGQRSTTKNQGRLLQLRLCLTARMPTFSKLFKSRDASSKKDAKPFVNGSTSPAKAEWSDAWIRTRVDPEEVAELISGCTRELKSRGVAHLTWEVRSQN